MSARLTIIFICILIKIQHLPDNYQYLYFDYNPTFVCTPANYQHLYFDQNPMQTFFSLDIRCENRGASFSRLEFLFKFVKLLPVPAFCPSMDPSFLMWKSPKSCFVTEKIFGRQMVPMTIKAMAAIALRAQTFISENLCCQKTYVVRCKTLWFPNRQFVVYSCLYAPLLTPLDTCAFPFDHAW